MQSCGVQSHFTQRATYPAPSMIHSSDQVITEQTQVILSSVGAGRYIAFPILSADIDLSQIY